MSAPKFDIAAYKKVGMLQQKQKEYFVIRLRCLCGDLSAEQLRVVAEVAQKYAKGQVHLSTRQGIEIHYIHFSDLEKARTELEASGLQMGVCGPRIRVVVCCPGAETCRWGIVETKPVATELDRLHFRQDTPHKFKLGVTGCPHNCAKATENDFGVMGAMLPAWEQATCINCGLCVNICPSQAITKREENDQAFYDLDESKCINCSVCTSGCPVNSWKPAIEGYTVTVGGTMGKLPRMGTVLKKFVRTPEEVYDLSNRVVAYYRANGRKRERFGHMMDRIGVDQVKREVLG